MKKATSHFDAFAQPTKADWLAQLAKDLKGKPLSDLDWQLEERVRLSAVYTAEDLPSPPPTLVHGRTNNAWQIGEYIDVHDAGAANAQALEGLRGGVNAPLFRFFHLPDVAELAVLLADIEPAYISVHFAPHYPDKDPAELFRNLIYYTRQRGVPLADIRGSIDFDPLLDWTSPPWPPLVRLLRFADRYMPQFKVLQINGQVLHTGADDSARELAWMVAKGVAYMAQLAELGVPPSVTNGHLQFSVAVGKRYFVEIAKIRALKLLWANVLAAYGIEGAALPPIAAHLATESQTDNREYNMISAATQAMSAAIGGADSVFVLPADAATQEQSSSFTRRIARNVQHLLQLESHLDRVADPAAGSYYIETLTQALAASAWAQFQDIEREGGFL